MYTLRCSPLFSENFGNIFHSCAFSQKMLLHSPLEIFEVQIRIFYEMESAKEFQVFFLTFLPKKSKSTFMFLFLFLFIFPRHIQL